MTEILLRPLAFVGWRLRDIFFDRSSWFEFFSGLAIMLSALPLLFLVPPRDLQSLDILVQLLPGHSWPLLCIAGGIMQLVGVLLQVRLVQALAAIANLFLIVVLVQFAWAAVGPTQFIFLVAFLGGVPNLFVFFRHVRDW